MEYTKELLDKAKTAESAEALQALARENGIEMSAEEAESYFAELHKSGELSDDELENVSGGGCRKNGHLVVVLGYDCVLWRCKDHRQPKVKAPDGERCANYKSGCRKVGSCKECYYCHYEKGLWLCYNPEK